MQAAAAGPATAARNVRVDRVARHVGDGDHGRRSRAATKEGDLTDAGARPEPVDGLAVDQHLDLAGLGHEEAVARLALGHQRGPRLGGERHEAFGQSLDRGQRQLGERRDLAQQAHGLVHRPR